ncbi:rRNA-processing protein UTP23-like [Symbiodinium microadriaticum]|uniref:rRNA-processing protein UTP23-like n=1 Tax=Symbiodinium microadriaticum TaxID=2951 RepID=A0A1Q9CNM5_SYMMI|nr:rRNA-processing protein UTP23-like [Symbiodinium microadriaticum]CAE7520485.1 UTP23 [Symbiodinium microadriaticum]CAE7553293.1 UTP23 [Symbiodinium sp. KB8]
MSQKRKLLPSYACCFDGHHDNFRLRFCKGVVADFLETQELCLHNFSCSESQEKFWNENNLVPVLVFGCRTLRVCGAAAMRVKRHKNHRRILRFFRLTFGIQEPYHVLVDGTFLTHALQQRIHVKEQLPKMLEGRTTPMTTGCILAELRSLGDRALGAAVIAKGYYRVKCGHDEHPIGASKCILEQIGRTNDRRFFVATQDPELRQELRSIPGVPLMRLNGPVPQLEEPSDSTRRLAREGEEKKREPSAWEKPKLPELKAKEVLREALASKPRAKRKQKGVNPLACKKSMKTKAGAVPSKPPKHIPAEPKAKRVRSRRMGNRSRVEVEAVLAASKATPAQGTADAAAMKRKRGRR